MLTLRRAWDVPGSRTGSVTPSSFDAFHRNAPASTLFSFLLFFFAKGDGDFRTLATSDVTPSTVNQSASLRDVKTGEKRNFAYRR